MLNFFGISAIFNKTLIEVFHAETLIILVFFGLIITLYSQRMKINDLFEGLINDIKTLLNMTILKKIELYESIKQKAYYNVIGFGILQTDMLNPTNVLVHYAETEKQSIIDYLRNQFVTIILQSKQKYLRTLYKNH